MKNIMLLFIGGGLGTIARYYLSKAIKIFMPTEFPLTILGVNALACFTSGLLISIFSQRIFADQYALKIFLIVGFCGGFSTFSGFSDQTVRLISENKFLYAGLDIILHIVLCVLLTLAGLKVGEKL